MTVRNIQTREGYDYWDKLCAIPRYGFIHSPDNSRILKAEGLGNWIDQHAAQVVVDDAQDEINILRGQRAVLLEALEATNLLLRTKRHACESGAVCAVLDAHINRNSAAIAKAKGEPTN